MKSQIYSYPSCCKCGWFMISKLRSTVVSAILLYCAALNVQPLAALSFEYFSLCSTYVRLSVNMKALPESRKGGGEQAISLFSSNHRDDRDLLIAPPDHSFRAKSFPSASGYDAARDMVRMIMGLVSMAVLIYQILPLHRLTQLLASTRVE